MPAARCPGRPLTDHFDHHRVASVVARNSVDRQYRRFEPIYAFVAALCLGGCGFVLVQHPSLGAKLAAIVAAADVPPQDDDSEPSSSARWFNIGLAVTAVSITTAIVILLLATDLG
jgi:hypothetical protein